MGKKYIVENRWTVQMVDYLFEYYKYVQDIMISSEQSRIIAIKGEEGKDRSQLLKKFEDSKLVYKDFQYLKEQV